jgi:hypothetical protein
MRRALLVLPLLLALGIAGSTPADRATGAAAHAFGVQILVPGQPPKIAQAAAAPDDAVQFGGAFSYPDDGSVVSVATTTVSVAASPGTVASSKASVELTTLKLFGGDITADTVDAAATTNATQNIAAGSFDASAFTNLVVLGQPVAPTPNQRIDLADWGYVILLQETGTQESSSPPGYDGVLTMLDVHLTADHGGLPAGSELQIGGAEVTAQAIPPQPVVPTGPKNTLPPPRSPIPPEPGIGGKSPVLPPPKVTPKLTAGGYVFPVYGPASFSDTFGGPRSDVSGGWHHGDDIFAPLGAPLLACASGTVFSVGWNTIGGNRLWIRDSAGNEFYYAHLSAFSPLAKNGAQVNAGDVVGFVGNTGDAQGTPYHLHFEVHPVGLLGLGYDGAVDPTSYLTAWEHLKDLPITDAGAFVVAPAPGAQAPKPGAILLQVNDISNASGLNPASLQRALAPTSSSGG